MRKLLAEFNKPDSNLTSLELKDDTMRHSFGNCTAMGVKRLIVKIGITTDYVEADLNFINIPEATILQVIKALEKVAPPQKKKRKPKPNAKL